MSKDFADPFALLPALCTRRASQIDRVDQLLERAGVDSATGWYDALEEDVRGDLKQLLDEFKTFFCPSALDHALRAESVFTRVQRPSERVRGYVAAVQKLARHMPIADSFKKSGNAGN